MILDFGGVGFGSRALVFGFEPGEDGDWAHVDAAATSGRVTVVGGGRGALGPQVVRVCIHGGDRRVRD